MLPKLCIPLSSASDHDHNAIILNIFFRKRVLNFLLLDIIILYIIYMKKKMFGCILLFGVETVRGYSSTFSGIFKNTSTYVLLVSPSIESRESTLITYYLLRSLITYVLYIATTLSGILKTMTL